MEAKKLYNKLQATKSIRPMDPQVGTDSTSLL
jgi:hypothetical protein